MVFLSEFLLGSGPSQPGSADICMLPPSARHHAQLLWRDLKTREPQQLSRRSLTWVGFGGHEQVNNLYRSVEWVVFGLWLQRHGCLEGDMLVWRASGKGLRWSRTSADAEKLSRQQSLGSGVNKGSIRINQDEQIASTSEGESLAKTRLCGAAGGAACLWRLDLT